MKLLADVNVDRMIVAGLRTDGHDVEWLAEDQMGRRMPDDTVVRLASRQGQIILTYDTDFARHIFTDLLPSNGVVLLRVGLNKTPRAQRNQRALEALRAYQGTLLGQFTTVYPDHVEQQALPPAPPPILMPSSRSPSARSNVSFLESHLACAAASQAAAKGVE